jgi:hypothetical protein
MKRIAIPAAVGALVIIAVIAVVVSSGSELELEPGSPEAAVQAYVRAVLDGDEDTAFGLLTADYQGELQRRCRDLRPPVDQDLRVTLREVDGGSGEATVQVRITESGGSGPFDQYQYSYEERFELKGSAGSWLIDLAPWALEVCGEES